MNQIVSDHPIQPKHNVNGMDMEIEIEKFNQLFSSSNNQLEKFEELDRS
jgi:hypothetical protein